MTFLFLHSLGHSEDDCWEMIEGDKKNVGCVGPGVSPRHIMQTLGTEWGRNQVYPNVWTDIALTQAEKLRNQGINVVIDDMRFPNEYDLVKHVGGQAWRINRPGTDAVNGHGSEGLLEGNDFSVNIENDKTLEDLHRSIAEAMA
jgi:hypothetical protein